MVVELGTDQMIVWQSTLALCMEEASKPLDGHRSRARAARGGGLLGTRWLTNDHHQARIDEDVTKYLVL